MPDDRQIGLVTARRCWLERSALSQLPWPRRAASVPDRSDVSVKTSLLRRPWFRQAALVLGALLAFAAHFRPWEVAFLEEWPLAEYWVDRGPIAFATHYFGWSLSRPLHLLPTELGLAVAGGAPGGIFLVLGLIASAQFLLTLWAIRSLSRAFWIGGAVALFIALHPLWPGGFLQRFLPAQAAALAMIIAAGLLIRWLQYGRIRWIATAAITMMVGLSIYPGPAVAAPLLAVALALAVEAPWRRRVVAVVAMTAASALMTVYSLVVTRLIDPRGGTYEAGNFTEATTAGPRQALATLGTTLNSHGFVILAGVVAITALGALLALIGAIPRRAGWLMSGAAAISPLCAIVYFGNVSWLQDIDRLGYATSLGLIAALLIPPITSLGGRPRAEAVIAVLLTILSLVGAARGIQHWQPYVQLQHRLLAELAPVVREAKGDEIVVVVDHSGTYGSEYTLPQHYINSASHVMNEDRTEVWLCSLATDPPLDGAVVCDPKDTGVGLRIVTSFGVPHGDVDIYIGQPESSG